ncbi:hypothetical protein Tco_0977115 [Tanacetum coccineum]|uniref:Uncharacterized protein n=1 Tax=Tanacetum coccineum TaxID=301880 RepID=A0ABQ5EJ70_9ASTR
MILKLADRVNNCPSGIAEDVFVKLGKFHFLADLRNEYSQKDKNKAKTGQNQARDWKERGKPKLKANASSADQPRPT